MADSNLYAKLEFSRKINEKSEINVNSRTLTIGRAESCNLQIPDKYISARHCSLEFSNDGKVYLCDSSSNGTFVDSERVKNKRIEVAFGSRIYLINKPNEMEQNLYFTIKMPDLDLDLDQTATYCLDNQADESKESNNETQVLPQLNDTPCLQITNDSKSNEPDFKKPRLERVSELAAKVDSPSPSTDLITGKKSPPCMDTKPKPENNGENKTEKPTTSGGEDAMAESLTCSICCEIIYDCISLQPCGHCFCAACYSDWMPRSRHCPECRLKVDRIAKNHRINNLIEAYLKEHPNKQRSDEEIKMLDAKNKITKDMVYPKKQKNILDAANANEDDEDDDEDYYSSTDEEDDNGDGTCNPPLLAPNPHLFNPPLFNVMPAIPVMVQPKCLQCPNYGRMPPAFNVHPPTKTPPAFVCGQFQNHILCVCCHTALPDRRYDHTCPVSIECSICKKPFCHLYFGCSRFGCRGCLNKFKEMDFGNDCLNTIINENQCESKILQDYLNGKNLQCNDLLKECLTKLDSGEYACRDKFAHGLTSESIVCMACGLNNFRDLAYEYRKNIPKTDLPDNVTLRPDCWYGRNCRTQRNNANHANRLNHICDQTKF